MKNFKVLIKFKVKVIRLIKDRNKKRIRKN